MRQIYVTNFLRTKYPLGSYRGDGQLPEAERKTLSPVLELSPELLQVLDWYKSTRGQPRITHGKRQQH